MTFISKVANAFCRPSVLIETPGFMHVLYALLKEYSTLYIHALRLLIQLTQTSRLTHFQFFDLKNILYQCLCGSFLRSITAFCFIFIISLLIIQLILIQAGQPVCILEFISLFSSYYKANPFVFSITLPSTDPIFLTFSKKKKVMNVVKQFFT